MSRYIDADELTKEIKSLQISCGGKNAFPDTAKESILRIINEQPTADVVEVKHGYWYDVDGDVGWELVSCSVCREKYSFCDGEDRTDYCPNCGAKMDGKKK